MLLAGEGASPVGEGWGLDVKTIRSCRGVSADGLEIIRGRPSWLPAEVMVPLAVKPTELFETRASSGEDRSGDSSGEAALPAGGCAFPLATDPTLELKNEGPLRSAPLPGQVLTVPAG